MISKSLLEVISKRIWAEKKQMPVNPWAKSGGTYVGQFEGEITSIGLELSKGLGAVDTRFNEDTKEAELYLRDGHILATIRVEGEMCMALYAKIRLIDLPDSVKPLFIKHLSSLTVKFIQE